MNIAIIDDEKYARLELRHQVSQILPDAQISEAGSGEAALKLMEKESFDIMFIDIHLGDIEGTTVASVVARLQPSASLIFVTAFPEYAVQAFDLHVDDYILKPFSSERIRDAIERCTQKKPEASALSKIAVNSSRKTTLLDVEDITYIETDGTGRGCLIHLSDGREYHDTTLLSDYESRLSASGFFRIHKTCLVQLKYVQDIFPWNNSSFALHIKGSAEILPIARDRTRLLRKELNI